MLKRCLVGNPGIGLVARILIIMVLEVYGYAILVNICIISEHR